MCGGMCPPGFFACTKVSHQQRGFASGFHNITGLYTWSLASVTLISQNATTLRSKKSGIWKSGLTCMHPEQNRLTQRNKTDSIRRYQKALESGPDMFRLSVDRERLRLYLTMLIAKCSCKSARMSWDTNTIPCLCLGVQPGPRSPNEQENHTIRIWNWPALSFREFWALAPRVRAATASRRCWMSMPDRIGTKRKGKVWQGRIWWILQILPGICTYAWFKLWLTLIGGTVLWPVVWIWS